MLTLKEFQEHLVSDATIVVSEFLKDTENNKLNPYAVMLNWLRDDSSFRVNFPPDVTELSRPEQYYYLSRLLSQGKYGSVGVVSFLKLKIDSPAEVDTRLWHRECWAALIGTVRPSSRWALNQDGHYHDNASPVQYDSSILLFDNVEGEEVIHKIEDMSVWQDYVNDVAVFRDFLYVASAQGEKVSHLRWPEFYRVLTHFGFEFDFTDEANKVDFLRNQNPVTKLA